MLTTSLRG